MRYLLDTHTFLWWVMQSSRLSPKVFDLCRDKSNTLWLSIASAWEIQIKHQRGKLALSAPLGEMIESQRVTNGIQLLPIELSHVLGLANLPAHHQDPFDRILVAQAMVEGLALVSHDPRLDLYSVSVVW